jgi:hypothetical protein
VNRDEFEHVLRSAANVVDDEIVVAGSQAVLGQFPDAPASLLRSHEVDVFPKNAPERAAEIDAAIGDGSRFHASFEYYAHGIGPETLIAPAGWESRLVRVELPAVAKKDRRAVGWCLEIHDLILSKLAAGRPHDLTFVLDALKAGLADLPQLRIGIDLMPPSYQDATRSRLEGLQNQLGKS